MIKIRDLEIINIKNNKLVSNEKIATGKNIFLDFKNTAKAITKNILQRIIVINKSLGQFKYEHILFSPSTSRKNYIHNSGLKLSLFLFLLYIIHNAIHRLKH